MCRMFPFCFLLDKQATFRLMLNIIKRYSFFLTRIALKLVRQIFITFSVSTAGECNLEPASCKAPAAQVKRNERKRRWNRLK